jgi:hypothetical protein
MSPRKIVVATHGHCFDGMASAVLFTHLRRNLEPAVEHFEYRSCGYGPKLKTVPDRWLRGDENAIIDFRYSPSERLHWYFDHHPTAFASRKEQAVATGRKQVFYDPSYDSCAKLIADVAVAEFGVDIDHFSELITWADRIDGANFDSAEQALDRTEKVMQLASVVEQHGNAPLLTELAAALLERTASEVADSEPVRQLWLPLAEAHAATRKRFTESARLIDEVVYVDMAEASLGSSGKFYAYALFPAAHYSVALLRMKQQFKVSIGFNPWSDTTRRHDIASLCQQHGGGGHADVGAVTFSLERLDDARRVAKSLVAELNR